MSDTGKIILDPKIKPVLTVEEVAELLGASKNSIYDLCHSTGFPALKVGKRFRIPTARFIIWLETAPTIAESAGLR